MINASLVPLLRARLQNRQAPVSVGSEVLDLAREHHVHLFLYNTSPPNKDILTDEQRARWRRDFLAGARDAESRRTQAAAFLRLLDRDSIPVIPLKGLWLAETVYAEPAARPMHDLDLLVRSPDGERAGAALEKAGYSALGPADGKHRVYHHPEWPLPVELHLRLEHEGPGSWDSTPIWDRARPATLAGQPCLAMSPEDLYVSLARHALFHQLGFFPLRSLLDLALVQIKTPLNWVQVAEVVRSLKMGRAFTLILDMVAELGGFEPIANWPQEWRPEPAVRAEAWRLILERGAFRAQPPASMVALENAPGFRERIKTIKDRIFLSDRELAAQFPWTARPGLRFLAPAARFGVLLNRYGNALFRQAKRDPKILEAMKVFQERQALLDRIYPDSKP